MSIGCWNNGTRPSSLVVSSSRRLNLSITGGIPLYSTFAKTIIAFACASFDACIHSAVVPKKIFTCEMVLTLVASMFNNAY